MQDIANLTDLSLALRTLASRSPDDVASGLTEAAAQLDMAVRLANRYGDLPLQDMLQAALGNAELGIGIQLRRLLQEVSGVRDVGRDTHGLVMGVQADIQALAQSTAERFSAIEMAITSLTTRADDGLSARGRQDERLTMLEAQMAGVQAQLHAEPIDG